MLSDEGRTITVQNDSGTTAIFAGDIVYGAANTNVLTQTAATARNAYAAGDILASSMLWSATGYQTVLGVALEDIPADGFGSVALEGVFIHPANEAIAAGENVQGDEATAVKLNALDTGNVEHKIGRALTGSSADTEYIVWKLSL